MTVFERLSILGALTGTSALIWDIYKWKKSRTNVLFDVTTNMAQYPKTHKSDDRLVMVEATNIGDGTVTLINLVLRYYSNKSQHIRQKPSRSMVVNPYFNTLPHKLLQGERWVAALDQTSELEEMSKRGILIIELYVAGRKKPKKAQVKLAR